MRTKSIIGALVLCALSICAFGAASASASGGLTAVTCTKAPGGPGTGHFETEHCETPEKAGSNFETVAVPEGTKVIATGEDPKLTASLKLVNVIITCKSSEATGKVTNTVEGGEMKAHGTEIVVTYKECVVKLKSNEAKTCTIEGEKPHITTNKLTSTTEGEHRIKFKPEGATPFATFTIGAGTCGLTGVVVEVTGSVVGTANTEKHSHVTFSEELELTNGSELKANGGKAFYHGTEVGYMDEEGTEGNTVGLTTESEFH